MLRTEDIEYFVRQVMRDKNTPFMTANCDLSKAVYEKVKKRCPQAMMYQDGCSVYICATERAKRKLLKSFEIRKKEQEEHLNRTEQMIERIQGDF